jgi:hypothetical protein
VAPPLSANCTSELRQHLSTDAAADGNAAVGVATSSFLATLEVQTNRQAHNVALKKEAACISEALMPTVRWPQKVTPLSNKGAPFQLLRFVEQIQHSLL